MWLISQDSSADEVQSQNAALIQTLNADMPKFHSHVMRQNFISLFGRMANVKPAYLRKIYHELTGDSSAASSEIESHVNEHVRQALELEDPDLVVDLRQHNKGNSSKYMEFWEACENYIQGNIETAVDDRRHDPIEHLAVAMSVPDLLSEVSKKVDQYHQFSGCDYSSGQSHLLQKQLYNIQGD